MAGLPAQVDMIDSRTPAPDTTPRIIKGICQVKEPLAVFSLFDLLFVFQGC